MLGRISYTIQFSTTLGGKLDVYDPDLNVIASQPLAPADMSPGPHTVRLAVPATALGTRGQCTFLLCPQEMDTTKDQAYRALWVMQGGTAQKNDLQIVSTSPANPSPIKWDPDTMQTAPISIFWQASTSASRTVTLSIYDTKQRLITTLPNQSTSSATSGTATFAWDGTVDGSADKAPAGLYLFKAEVKGIGGHDIDKSPYLQVTAPDADAELASDDGTTAQHNVTYTLTSDPDRPASRGRIDVYAPDQTLAATQSLTADQLTSGAHTVTVTLLSPQLAGTYTFLVCSMDSHADLDAFGRTRYALQHNQQAFHPTAIAWAHGDLTSTAKFFWEELNRDGFGQVPHFQNWYHDPVISDVRGPLQLRSDPLRVALFAGHGSPDGRVLALSSNKYIVATNAAMTTDQAIVQGKDCLVLETLTNPNPPVAGKPLSYLKLVVLDGCDMGSGADNGGIVDELLALGVQCVVEIGQHGLDKDLTITFIGTPMSYGPTKGVPQQGFLYHLEQGETVQNAADAASEFTYEQYRSLPNKLPKDENGAPIGFRARVYGNGSLTINDLKKR